MLQWAVSSIIVGRSGDQTRRDSRRRRLSFCSCRSPQRSPGVAAVVGSDRGGVRFDDRGDDRDWTRRNAHVVRESDTVNLPIPFPAAAPAATPMSSPCQGLREHRSRNPKHSKAVRQHRPSASAPIDLPCRRARAARPGKGRWRWTDPGRHQAPTRSCAAADASARSLISCWKRVRAGQSRVLVMRGEAGVGKTALLGLSRGERRANCRIAAGGGRRVRDGARVRGVASALQRRCSTVWSVCPARRPMRSARRSA